MQHFVVMREKKFLITLEAKYFQQKIKIKF